MMREDRAETMPAAGGDEGPSMPTAPDAPEVAPLAHRAAGTPPDGHGPLTLDAPGGLLAGRYEILERLGTGGMGTVHRARDRALGEDVALKVLRADPAGDPRALERFRGEVRLARRIAHPGVCRVFDIGEAGGLAFLTMELCRGGTLRARLRAGLPPIEDALRWLGEIARGLAAMHGEGILHRDLKPENVLFRDDGSVVVSDFGLALPSDALVTSAAGTPVYMSPEQLRGDPLDEKSDVFALGIVAYELFSGRRPFGEGPAALVTSAILQDAPAPLEVAGAPEALARALADLAGRALAKSAEARPSAAAFAEAIDALAKSPTELPGTAASAEAAGPPRAGTRAQAREDAPGEDATRPRAAPRERPGLRIAAPILAAALVLAIAWLRGRASVPPAPADPAAPASATGPAATGPATANPAASSPSTDVVVHVPAVRNATGDPELDELAAAVTDTARRALSTVRGVRVAPGPDGARVLAASLQRVEGRLRFSGQTRAPDGHAEPELTADAAGASALLDAVRDRVIAEGRLLAAAAARARRAAACAAPAEEPLARYERLVGPAPRSEHVAAGLPLLDAALAADPRCVHAHVERAQLLGLRAAEQRDPADLDLADRALDAALALSPDDAPALSYRCRLAVFRPSMMGAIDDAAIDAAERACRSAQQADPDSAQVWRARATLLDRTCRDEEAMKALEEAASRDRALAGDALAHLIGLALQNGRIGVADRTSLELLALEDEERRLGPAAWSRRAGHEPPEHASFARAEVLLRLGREAEAVDLFRQELARAGTGSLDLLAELASLHALARIGAHVDKPITKDEAARLRALESEIEALATRDPSVPATVAGALLWKDTGAALRWLDRAPAPDGCTAAIQRAFVYKAGDRAEQARRALAGCVPRARWERQCLAWARERVGL